MRTMFGWLSRWLRNYLGPQSRQRPGARGDGLREELERHEVRLTFLAQRLVASQPDLAHAARAPVGRGAQTVIRSHGRAGEKNLLFIPRSQFPSPLASRPVVQAKRHCGQSPRNPLECIGRLHRLHSRATLTVAHLGSRLSPPGENSKECKYSIPRPPRWHSHGLGDFLTETLAESLAQAQRTAVLTASLETPSSSANSEYGLSKVWPVSRPRRQSNNRPLLPGG